MILPMWSSARKLPQPLYSLLPDYFPAETATQLLAPFQPLIQSIRSEVGLPVSHWQQIYLPVLHNYAELCQRLPASEAHHHADAGGLLRHGLETLSEALKLRRPQLLPPGAPAEEIADQQDLWTYATATSALLHDIGKPITDVAVNIFHPSNGKIRRWQPLTAPLPNGAHYSFRFNPQRRHHQHALIRPLLVHRIIPQPGLDWLTKDAPVFDAWLSAISGDIGAGPLAAIAQEADGISAARDLSGGAPVRSPGARAKPLAERLLTGLRHLVREGMITLNRPGASGFVANGSLWLVSKRVLDELREHLTQEGQTGIPGRNDRLMDELQQRGILQPNGDRAIWHCRIEIGDWCHMLSCIRMEVKQIWPNSASVAPGIDGSITPVNPPSEQSHAEVLANQNTVVSNLKSEPTTGVKPEAHEALSQTPPRPSPNENEHLPIRVELPETTATISVDNEISPSYPSEPRTTPENEDIGQRFVDWLTQNIRNGRVEINTPRARLHILREGLAMITPGIFRDFNPERWEYAQKRFQKLKIHKKTPNDTNVWKCQVAKDRKRSIIRVMLIPNAEEVLGVRIPDVNPATTLIIET